MKSTLAKPLGRARNLLCGLVAASLTSVISTSTNPAAADIFGLTMAQVGQEAAKGVVAYVAGKAFGEVVLVEAKPLTEDRVRSLIDEAVAEIKRFVRAEIDQQLDQKHLDLLVTHSASIDGKMREYAAATAADPDIKDPAAQEEDIRSKRLQFKYLLDSIDLETRQTMNEAATLGIGARPVLASFINSRFLVLLVIAREQQNYGPLDEFLTNDLVLRTAQVEEAVATFEAMYTPENRFCGLRYPWRNAELYGICNAPQCVVKICSWISGNGGFICGFEGVLGPGSLGGDWDDKVDLLKMSSHGLIDQAASEFEAMRRSYYQQRTVTWMPTLQEEQAKAKAELIGPLGSMLTMWRDLAEKCKKTNQPRC